jgi:regulator of protease activity HflC (stomatin/prohibitin superfamily)
MIALVGLTELEIELAVIALIVIVGVIAVAVAGIKIVGQYERGLIESWGAYSKTVGPGLKFIMPIRDKIYRVNMREQVIDVPPQEIITEDNVVVNVDAVVYYQIMDPKRAIYEIEDFEMAIVKLAQTTLRNVVGEMTLDTCLTSREKINIDLRKVLDEATDKWGTKVNRIEV